MSTVLPPPCPWGPLRMAPLPYRSRCSAPTGVFGGGGWGVGGGQGSGVGGRRVTSISQPLQRHWSSESSLSTASDFCYSVKSISLGKKTPHKRNQRWMEKEKRSHQLNMAGALLTASLVGLLPSRVPGFTSSHF